MPYLLMEELLLWWDFKDNLLELPLCLFTVCAFPDPSSLSLLPMAGREDIALAFFDLKLLVIDFELGLLLLASGKYMFILSSAIKGFPLCWFSKIANSFSLLNFSGWLCCSLDKWDLTPFFLLLPFLDLWYFDPLSEFTFPLLEACEFQLQFYALSPTKFGWCIPSHQLPLRFY